MVAAALGDPGWRQKNVAGATHPNGATREQQLNDLPDRGARSVVGQISAGSLEAAAAAAMKLSAVKLQQVLFLSFSAPVTSQPRKSSILRKEHKIKL